MCLTFQKLEHPIPGGKTFFWAVLFTALSFGFQRANALNPGAVSITNKSGTRFVVDSNDGCNGPRAAYVAYTICNTTGVVLNNLSASLNGLASGYALAGGQLASQTIGTLTPGACASLFWYVGYPCTVPVATNLIVTVSDGNPGTVSSSNNVSTVNSQSSSAGSVIESFATGPALVLGMNSYIDINYKFGNIPKNGNAYVQPTGNADFSAGCMQLTGVEVVSSDFQSVVPVGTTNTLNFIAPVQDNSGSHRVTIRYFFKIACATISTNMKPYSASSSGSQFKHIPNYGEVFIDVPIAFPAPNPCLVGSPDDFAALQTTTGIETTGDNWSASWGDYDNDGYPDLFLTTHEETQPNALYRNNRNGTFSKVNSTPFSTDLASSLSSSWGDYDNDGDLDLYVANNIGFANFLYRNEGGGSFTKILNDPIVSNTGYSHGVSWGDYDNDGFLDMFVAVYWETAFNLLYHNNGDGTFSEVTNNAITNEASRSVSGAWGDFNNDGLLDLFVANTGGQNNSLYQNLGGGDFLRITTGAIVNDGGSSVGASWADYNNDGNLDLFVTNAGNEPNYLYKNNGDGTFSKITSGTIVTDRGDAHGSAWADWDNDGDLDLFVARDGRDNSLYRNDGSDVFTGISNAMTTGGGLSFGSAWADYDRDGDLDLIVANRLGTGNFFFKNNKGTCNNWASIKLIGTNSNKSAIGARVYVTATINGNVVTQMREVSAQTGGGTGGQNDLTLSFGLGNATTISNMTIEWPSGYQQVVTNQPSNQFLQFTEVDGAEICGTVFNDTNLNCVQEVGEYGIAGTAIVLNPGGITAYTDADGNYSVYVKPGIYTLQEIPSSIWTPNCPNILGTRTVNAAALGGTYCGNNFGNRALVLQPDLLTEIISAAHRIGENNLMFVNYENLGTVTAEGVQMTVTVPSDIEVLLTSLPQLPAKAQNLVFDLGNMPPNAKGVLYISYTVPLTTPIGMALTVSANITGTTADFNASNNTSADISTAVASYDPNDIAVSPARYVKKGEWLQYKIRFQNVGNIPASQVRVEDELPEGLDLSTIELGRASHNYKFQLQDRKLVWSFPNINLADSLSNEKESHGYITFRIKPKEGLSIGERMLNRAAIYFDNLEPVITNTVENVMTDNIAKQTSAAVKALQIHPSPSLGKVTVQSFEMSLEPDAFFVEMLVFDRLGKQVYQAKNVANQRQELYLQHLTNGNYYVKAVDSKGRVYAGKVVLAKD
jgi:uncharacterized repeat protein (TIGR01451 family)